LCFRTLRATSSACSGRAYPEPAIPDIPHSLWDKVTHVALVEKLEMAGVWPVGRFGWIGIVIGFVAVGFGIDWLVVGSRPQDPQSEDFHSLLLVPGGFALAIGIIVLLMSSLSLFFWTHEHPPR
jgi:hypothetical protein